MSTNMLLGQIRVNFVRNTGYTAEPNQWELHLACRKTINMSYFSAHLYSIHMPDPIAIWMHRRFSCITLYETCCLFEWFGWDVSVVIGRGFGNWKLCHPFSVITQRCRQNIGRLNISIYNINKRRKFYILFFCLFVVFIGEGGFKIMLLNKNTWWPQTSEPSACGVGSLRLMPGSDLPSCTTRLWVFTYRSPGHLWPCHAALINNRIAPGKTPLDWKYPTLPELQLLPVRDN